MPVQQVMYLQPPVTIGNQALDRIGVVGKTMGDANDGTDISETFRRNYGQGLRQLLRTAHWNFARKRAKLTLLGDVTQDSQPPVSPHVEAPWTYAYAWPTDAVQGRWMPFDPGSVIPVGGNGVPLTTGPVLAPWYPMMPGRFLISSSDLYPIETGEQQWNELPDLQRTEGLGPNSRKVILSDCGPHGHFVYTRLVTVIEEWDSLFREALVTMMAMVLAPVAIEDPKLRVAEVQRLTPILQNAVADARVANGNEAGFPQTINQEAIYIRARNYGGWGGVGDTGFGFGLGGSNGAGYFGLGWESLNWNGSVY